MKSPGYYKGREQTYLKHFFLDKYLETVLFHIGFAQSEFVYVDCFSGPWRHEHEDLADTSIRISLDKLNYVREALGKQQKHPAIRAIFVEKDPIAFAALQHTIGQHHGGVKTVAFPGEFEDNIPRILGEVGKGFAFCFIDPTGWSVAMQRLQPLLRHKPSEVMINFMYDFINRAINSEDPTTAASLDRFFGTHTWRTLRDVGDRETAIINFYEDRIRTVGNFTYVTSTKILKPLQERAYFHLIYATRSSKGIEKFRDVEKQLVLEQQKVRATAQRENREQQSRQDEFQFNDSGTLSSSVEEERATQIMKAKGRLFELLQGRDRQYGELLAELLQLRLFWRTDLNDLLKKERWPAGRILIDGMKALQRVPNEGCIIRLASAAGPDASAQRGTP